MASINATTSSGIVATADNTGQLQLQSAGTTSATFNTFGIGLGTATPSSGIGITFPATQSASSDANTLDDYEEGTWTASITFGGASVGIVYTSQFGYYVKIGRVVHVTCYIAISSKGSSTGAIAFTGFPFTSQNVSNGFNTFSFYCGSATSTSGSYMCYISPNTTSALLAFSQTGTPGTFSNTQANNASDYIISGTYIATA
jgi:hypothetical protein